jgi:hypothetical protein
LSGSTKLVGMAYRLHVIVYDGTRRLNAERLARELPALLGNPRVGVIGTRYGAPGLWVERDSAAEIRAAAGAIRHFGQNTGYLFRFAATNEPTLAAVRDLVPVERG